MTFSVLDAVGAVLMVIGMALVVVAVVRGRGIEDLGRTAELPPMFLWHFLPLGSSWHVVRRAYRRGPGAGAPVETVRAAARGEARAPVLPTSIVVGAVLVLVGAAALDGWWPVALGWLVAAAVVATNPWQVRARRRRARVVLAGLPPEEGGR